MVLAGHTRQVLGRAYWQSECAPRTLPMLLNVRNQLLTVHLARRRALPLLDGRRLLSQIFDRMFGGLLAREEPQRIGLEKTG